MCLLDRSEFYKKETISKKPVYIFEAHNLALPVWATYSNCFGALHLLSFDSRNDTFPPFNSYLVKKGIIANQDYRKSILLSEVQHLLPCIKHEGDSFSLDNVLRYSMEMPNREQILTGVVLGYLKSYVIRCHSDGYEAEDRFFGYDATYISDEDERVPQIRSPLFLDIDLSFFRSRDELDSGFINYCAPFFQEACAVTVARESACFDKGKTENDFSVEEAEKKLLDLLAAVE